MALFDGNEQVHGTHWTPEQSDDKRKWTIKTSAKTLREPVTIELWVQHLEGKRPLGVVFIRNDSTTKIGSIDVDIYDEDLRGLIAAIRERKLPLVPCRSKSGGLHLFLFLRSPIPAVDVIAILKGLAASLGIGGSEIFPKQARILSERGDMGNWMVMPYYGDTFDGKLKEQVGIADSGEDMSAEEFLDAAEKARLSTEQFLELQRTALPAPKPPGKERRGAKAGTAPADGVPDTSDGPPCLQILSQQKVGRGVQSNYLMHFGIFLKKKYPDDWKRMLEVVSRTFLDPPGSDDGLKSVVRSLEKKDYEYLCKVEPMCSHCDSALCMTRKFGVGDEGAFPRISGLAKMSADPAIWFVDVNGQRVEMGTLDLQNYVRFHAVCMERLSQCFSPMKQSTWWRMVGEAMQTMTEIEPPKEATALEIFREQLEDFLVNRQRGRDRADILIGRPWEDEEKQRHYFRGRDLETYLKREGTRDVRRGELYRKIEQLGGQREQLHILGQMPRVWWVPSSVVNQTPDVGAPAPVKKQNGADL